MTEVIGYVSGINLKQGMGKNGKPYTVYNVNLMQKDGSELRVGWGFNAPAFQEGVWIKTTAEQNGQYLNYKGAPVETAPGAAPAQASAPSTQPSSSGGSKDGYWEEKDRYYKEVEIPRITFSASRTAALTFLGILDKHDALPLSSAAGKAGQTKRFEQLHEYLEKLTVQFYHDADTLRLLEKVADAGVVEVPLRGELPDEVTEEEEQEDMFENESSTDPFGG